MLSRIEQEHAVQIGVFQERRLVVVPSIVATLNDPMEQQCESDPELPAESELAGSELEAECGLEAVEQQLDSVFCEAIRAVVARQTTP